MSYKKAWLLAEDALASIAGEITPKFFPETSYDCAKRTLKEAREVLEAKPEPAGFPERDSWWKYKTGIVYQVIGVANTAHQHPDHPAEVVYRGTNGNFWTYLLSEWKDNFEPYDVSNN